MLRETFKITTNDRMEYYVLNKIHEALVGNPDYVNSSIVLNDSGTRGDNTDNEVHIYVFEDSVNTPDFLSIIDNISNIRSITYERNNSKNLG